MELVKSRIERFMMIIAIILISIILCGCSGSDSSDKSTSNTDSAGRYFSEKFTDQGIEFTVIFYENNGHLYCRGLFPPDVKTGEFGGYIGEWTEISYQADH